MSNKPLIGVIVDSENDPDFIGRCKVRMLDQTTLLDDELPWVGVSSKNGGVGGIGHGPSGLKKGATVHLEKFDDQNFMIIGEIGKSGESNDSSVKRGNELTSLSPAARGAEGGGGDFRLIAGDAKSGPVEFGTPFDTSKYDQKSIHEFAKTESNKKAVKDGDQSWTMGDSLSYPFEV